MKLSKNFIIFIFFTTALLGCTKAFIDEGAVAPPIDGVIKYNPDIQGLMYNHCITCHGGSAPSGGFTLTTYEDVRSYTENGNLRERINDTDNPMPPSGLLNAENLQIIENWVENGFQEN